MLIAGAMVAVAATSARANDGSYDGGVQFSQTSALLGGGGQPGCGDAQAGCGDCTDSCANACCDPCLGTWQDNTILFAATDAWSNLGDGVAAASPFGLTRVQANYGVRFGANTGYGIGNLKVRAQLGSSYGAYDLKGRTDFTGAPGIREGAVEQQVFITGGFYKRSEILNDDPVAWAVVYDSMYDSDWGAAGQGNVNFGQVRTYYGYALSESNEVGIWGTARAQSATAAPLGLAPGKFRAVDQSNLFWHHNWESGGDTWLSIGVADAPTSWTLGFAGQAPLSCGVSLFSSANYYIPGSRTGGAGSAEEIWNVSAGLAISLGGKAHNRTVSGHGGLPLLNVADNGTFGLQR